MIMLAQAKADSDQKLQSAQVETRLLRHRLGLSGTGSKGSADVEERSTEISEKVGKTFGEKLPCFVELANSKARVASLKAEIRVLKTRLARMLQVGSLSRQGSSVSLGSPNFKSRLLD